MCRTMQLIKPGLYAGTRQDAVDIAKLTETEICRVLTIDSEALPRDVTNGRRTLFICCLDQTNADLLSYFDKCVDFIEEGLQNNESILVHCLAGVSRSITILLAYLMKTECKSYNDAKRMLSEICSSKIKPNYGFTEQLYLYEEMGCKVDFSSPVFKQYRLQLLASQIQEGGQESSVALVSQFIQDFTSKTSSGQKQYKCRKCRRTLFDSDSIVEHDAGQGESTFNWHKRDKLSSLTSAALPSCTSLFIEPVEWILPSLEGTIDGKISCPKCNARLGSFNWAGMQCSCGSWVTPAFQFHKNKVDEAFTVAAPLLHSNSQSQHRTLET